MSRICCAILLFSTLVLSNYYIIIQDPYQLIWLCNFTAIFSLILLFAFHQFIFDIIFFIGIHASLVPCFDPSNSAIQNDSLTLLVFLLKHFLPLICIFYLMYMQERKLSPFAYKRAVIFLIIFFCFIVGYNLVFDKNILATREPVGAFKYMGPWPIYNIVNALLVMGLYYGIFRFCKKLRLVHIIPSKNKSE